MASLGGRRGGWGKGYETGDTQLTAAAGCGCGDGWRSAWGQLQNLLCQAKTPGLDPEVGSHRRL